MGIHRRLLSHSLRCEDGGRSPDLSKDFLSGLCELDFEICVGVHQKGNTCGKEVREVEREHGPGGR